MKSLYFKITIIPIHLFFLIALFHVSFQEGMSQNISGKIFGQNAWMPYSIGSTVYNGKMDSQWKKVKDSHTKITRYGGIAVDKNMPTNEQYLNMIDSIRGNGMEPVMLVSFYNNTYTASQAAQTVEFINITSSKNVKYWVIGNEPDNEYGFVNAAQVADYIREFSLAMKNKDSSIKILAPETAWYNQNIIDGLTTPGGLNDITGKDSLGNFIIDIISFHIFPFRGTQRRNDVLAYLSAPDHFEDDLTQLNQKIAACNSYHQRNLNSQLKVAVTEANVNWKNPQGDGIFDVGANSFIGGQFWAEMIGICMKKNVDFINFWSVIEGNELGYLYQASSLPKPSYYHFQMLADNFKGTYCNGTDNNTNIKSFGSKNEDQISVIIMNQDQSNDFIFKLRLDNNLISGTDPLKINIDAGTNIEYSDTLSRESSIVLIFNTSGFLINKCVYKLYGNADQGIPPTCNIKTVLPVTTKTSASFAVIGDFGLAGNNELAIANLVKSWNPDFIITTGDNNYELGQSSTIDANIGQYYHDYIYPYSGNYGAGADSIRFFPSLGNHDLDTDNGAPYLQYFTLPGNERYYDYVKGNIHFFVLNSDIREVNGVDSSSIQALWLKDKLQNSISKWNVVYYHHPPYCSERDHGSQVYMQWPFKRWGADIVLSGHSHVYERLVVDSFPYIVNGVGGKSLHPFDPLPLPETIIRYNSDYGAMLCNEYSDTLSFRFYNKGGNLIDSYFLTKNQTALSVSISSPLNNSTYSLGSPITINATFTGSVSGIKMVEFFADTTKLGEDISAPYSFTWNNAPAGNYSLKVKVTDSLGNTAVSGIITITVNAIVPLTSSITSPVNNASFIADSDITIQATASGGTGTIQKVEFYADSIKLGEDISAPYSFTWNNVQVGNYSLKVIATDSIGNTAVSGMITITVNATMPLTASITSPVNNASFMADSDVTIQSTASGGTGPIQKVEFYADSIKLGEDISAPYSLTWNNVQAGNYSLKIIATDSIGNTAVSGMITITVNAIVPLTSSITSPVNNASFMADSSIIIQATASGGTGTIQKVEFYADSIKLGEDLTSPYSFIWSNAPAGNHQLTVKATDSINDTFFSVIVNIIVSNPLVTTIISPLNNSSFTTDSTITIQATASGGIGGIQRVEFFAGTTKLGEDISSPYSFVWINAAIGNYALTVKAADSINNVAVSGIINITVNPAPLKCSATGTIAREVWSNISGTSVSAIPLAIAPSLTGELTVFQAPENFGNNYGQRIRGYVCPPATGNYIFWIASDNNSELWLSTNDNAANKIKIASVSGSTSPRQWTKYSSQKSVSKNLIAGQKYYIEALHKEGNQNDNCAVGWQLPSGALERPIPGNRLLPFEIIPPIPSIELVSAGSSWKYLDNGSNQGTEWYATSFSDATWNAGNAELGYGDGGESTIVSYGPSSTNKYITTYFRKTFNVSDISTISGLELSLIRDDGAVLYINGNEVYRNNLPSGTIYYNTLAPSYIDGVNESTFVIANISSSALVNGANLIAVEIHQNAVTSSDISFNLKLKTISGSRIMDNEITNDTIEENTISENAFTMIVYPNPTTGRFNLEFCIDDLKEKTVVIEITNSIGQVIHKQQPQKINGCIKETIELEASLPIGVYIMKVIIDDKIQTSKMLLTR